MSWHYLAEAAVDSSPVCCTDGELLPPSKSRSTRAGFYCKGKLTESYLDSLYGTTFARSTGNPGEERSMSLVEGSRVRISVHVDEAKGSRASDPACGPKWRELSMRYDPDTFTLKTHHCLFSEDLPLSCATLPKWGSMRDGVLLEPTTLPLDTAAKGVGFMESMWPTPTAAEADKIPGTANYGQIGLNNHPRIRGEPKRKKMEKDTVGYDGSLPRVFGDVNEAHKATWPTPTANHGRNETSSRKPGSKHNTGTTLHDIAYKLARGATPETVLNKATYPTPTARDHKDRCGHTMPPRKDGRSRLDLLPRVIKEKGQLSPDWVEWLMGWPIGWTDLEPMSRDDFNRWKTLTMSGEWFLVDPADDGTTPRICTGVKDRAKRLKAIGNGQVPLCAATAWSILSGDNE